VITALEESLINYLQLLFERLGWWGVSVVMILEYATGVTPSDLILGLAGWLLLAANRAGPGMILVAGLYAAFGSALGASASYWLVRLGGRPLVDRGLRVLRINPLYLEWVEVQFKRWGPSLVLFGRAIPIVRILVSIPAGLVRMPFPQFFVYSFTGAYIWCTGLIAVGYIVGNQWFYYSALIKDYMPWFAFGALLLAVLVWVGRGWLQQHLLNRLMLIREGNSNPNPSRR
jgi:membrane protein DedA with SNARE-associated domain